MSSRKKLVDCKFYMRDPLSCRNGMYCSFRHSAIASRQQRVCKQWFEGRCRDRLCVYQHPDLRVPPVERSACASCFESYCICGYGNTATTSYYDQTHSQAQSETEEQNDNVGFSVQATTSYYDQTHSQAQSETEEQNDNVVGDECIFSKLHYLATGGAKQLRLSEDGRSLATYGQGAEVKLWSTRTREQGRSLWHSAEVTDVWNGTETIGSSSKDETVKLWDVNVNSATARLTRVMKHERALLSLDTVPAKQQICPLDTEAILSFWDMEQHSKEPVETVVLDACGGGQQQGMIRTQHGGGRLLAVAVGSRVILVEVKTGVIVHTLENHGLHSVGSLSWSKDDLMVASVSEEIINVWDIRSNKNLRLKASRGNNFHDAVFHPCLPILVIGLQKNMQVWQYGKNPADEKTTMLRESAGSLSSAADVLASSHERGLVRIWTF